MNKMTMLVMFLSLAFVGKTEARGTGTFTCSVPGLTNQQMTIPMSLVCDGVITCGLGEDEKDCPAISATTTTPPTTTTTPKPDMSIVLITGSGSGNNQMEIINHDNSTTKCQNDYTYPISVLGASGAVVDGTIVVCGGGRSITRQCYSFGHEKEWKNITDMTTARAFAASVQLNNALWVGGGYDERNYLKSTEVVYLDERRSSTKPQLPEVRWGSCAAEYNGNIFFTGGYAGNYAHDNNWIINTNDDFKLTNGPNMLNTRVGHSCGIFHSNAHSGRAVIVTAGSGNIGTGFKNCEFWDFTVQGTTWQLCSQNLPTEMKYGPQMTPTADGKGLVLSHEHSVYSFICQSETNCWFTTTDIELKIERSHHLMLQVPSSLLSEC